MDIKSIEWDRSNREEGLDYSKDNHHNHNHHYFFSNFILLFNTLSVFNASLKKGNLHLAGLQRLITI